MAISQIHPKYHHPAIITKADKDFLKTVDFDFKDIKFPVKTRDIHKSEKKKNSIAISIFGYKNFQSMYQKMFCQETCLLLLIGGEGKGTMLYLLKLLIHFVQ